MEETYWCHRCSRRVNPICEIDGIQCPICESGFIEEMATAPGNDVHLDFSLGGSDSDRALSLWAPILLGMVGDPRPRSRSRRSENEDGENEDNERQNVSEAELDRELELILRRRRNSAAILQLLQGIRARAQSESGNTETDHPRIRDRENERERESVILINPSLTEAIIVGSYGRGNDSQHRAPSASLGDYFVGPGLDMLLQHLLENDLNRYGTPPAKKEAVESLDDVKTEEAMQCSICLDDCEEGCEVKEMPCKHRFHGSCILPWLELHSSCPICRFQLPCDESKTESVDSTNNSGISHQESNSYRSNVGGESNENAGQLQLQLQLPWPFSSLFPAPTIRQSRGNASTTDTPGSSAGPTASQEDEN